MFLIESCAKQQIYLDNLSEKGSLLIFLSTAQQVQIVLCKSLETKQP